jgi:hypothetical protein
MQERKKTGQTLRFAQLTHFPLSSTKRFALTLKETKMEKETADKNLRKVDRRRKHECNAEKCCKSPHSDRVEKKCVAKYFKTFLEE